MQWEHVYHPLRIEGGGGGGGEGGGGGSGRGGSVYEDGLGANKMTEDCASQSGLAGSDFLLFALAGASQGGAPPLLFVQPVRELFTAPFTHAFTF